MLRAAQRMAISIALVSWLAHLLGAEPALGKQTAPSASGTAELQADGGATQAGSTDRPDAWRYRLHNGRWWYWTADKRWLIWSPPQGWVAQQPAVTRAPAPAGDAWRWGWDPANPFNRYPPGRPINSPRSFPKNM